MDFIPPWLAPLAAALASGLSVWNFFQAPSKRNAEEIGQLRLNVSTDIKDLRKVVDGVDDRVVQLEALIGQVPTKDSIHDLAMGIERISGRLETMNARLDPIDHLGRRLQEVLLENRK